MAPGAGAILGELTLASIRRFPKPHYLLFFLAAGFGSTIILFALSRHFRFHSFFILRRRFSDDVSFLGSDLAANPQR
jgi:hypothetical protein